MYLNHVILGVGWPLTSQSKLIRPSKPTDASWGSLVHFGGAKRKNSVLDTETLNTQRKNCK